MAESSPVEVGIKHPQRQRHLKRSFIKKDASLVFISRHCSRIITLAQQWLLHKNSTKAIVLAIRVEQTNRSDKLTTLLLATPPLKAP